MIDKIEIFKEGVLCEVDIEAVNITKRITLIEKISHEEANHEYFNLDWYKLWKNSEKTGWTYGGQLLK